MIKYYTMEQISVNPYKAMRDWIQANGGIFDAVEVPVTFPGGEVGIAASRDIPARTAAIYVPGRCIVSHRKAL